jgi:hypothetical protein
VVTETSPRPSPAERPPLQIFEVEDLKHIIEDTFLRLASPGPFAPAPALMARPADDIRFGIRTLFELGILNRVPR